jgi:hypothetical protein
MSPQITASPTAKARICSVITPAPRASESYAALRGHSGALTRASVDHSTALTPTSETVLWSLAPTTCRAEPFPRLGTAASLGEVRKHGLHIGNRY